LESRLRRHRARSQFPDHFLPDFGTGRDVIEVHFLEQQLSCLQPVVMARDAVSSDKNSWFGSWLLCSGHRQSAENHQQNNDPTSPHYCSLRGTNNPSEVVESSSLERELAADYANPCRTYSALRLAWP